MGRNGVPAEDVDVELAENRLDDRRRRLRRAVSPELALGGERDPGDSGAPESGRLADEQHGCARVHLEIRAQALSADGRAASLAVEVVRLSDSRRRECADELSRIHSVTMLMRVRAWVGVGVIVAAFAAPVGATAQAAVPPQGYQSDAAFAESYAARAVSSVAATAQRVSCYAPEVPVFNGLASDQGFPDGGGTACPGATTGENIGPYPSQDIKPPALLVKDHSESDIHVDPTNPRHLIGVSKWFVNAEYYNHLTGFFESFDGGATWPQQGHIPGYEGWTDNSDPAGAFDPWGNFYTVVLPYMFDYTSAGSHTFLSPSVNPTLPRSGVAIAVRPHGAATANAWLTAHAGRTDFVATTPFQGQDVFDKQWIAIDNSRRSKHFGRVYVMWAISGNTDSGLRIFESHADAHPDGSHTNWSVPKLVFRQAQGFGDNGALPHVAPDGTVWVTTAAFRGDGPLTTSLSSSRNGGATWAGRRVVVRHTQSLYDNTTFRAAFGEAFAVGPKRIGKYYPLYLAYEDGPAGPVQIWLKASFDGGRHWRKAIQVNDNRSGGEALQPGIAVAPTGTVVVSFYDRRLPCAARGSAEATGSGVGLDPQQPYGRANYCINTAAQLYRPGLRPIGHNVRMSPHTWDPQLSSARPECICAPSSFIGDYFGVDARGGFAYTSSVTTYNEGGTNPLFHQQQLVAKLRIP